MPPRALPLTLSEIEGAQLVRRTDERDATLIFKHALIQDTAYASLTRHERKRLHRLVAETYETMYADRCMDEFAGLLTRHYAEAGDDAKTLAYATRAGDLAASEYANTEALAFYTQALDAAVRLGAADRNRVSTTLLIHLYTKRGRIYEVTGRDLAALQTYQDMRAFAHIQNDRALELGALLLQGKLRSVPSVVFDRAQALALAAEANALAVELDDREAQANIMWNQLLLALYGGDISRAVEYGEQAMALARELDVRELLAYILGDLARAYMNLGQMERVVVLQEESLALWHALDNKPMQADMLMQSATHAMMLGEYDHTLALTEKGIELSQLIDSKLSLLANLGTQQAVYFERGDFGRALQSVREIIRISMEMRLSFNGPLGYTCAAWLYGAMGAFEQGTEMAQRAREILDGPLPEFFRGWGWVMLSNFYMATQNWDAVREALDAAHIQQIMHHGSPSGSFGIIALGHYLYARGEFARAAQHMAERVRELHSIGMKMSLHEALLIQAQAVRALGDSAQAYNLLQQARANAEEMQARRILSYLYPLLGEMENERGNVEQANAYRAQAREVLEFIVEHTPPEFRESFLNLPRVREVMA